jgi:hypothetical protein
MNSFFLSVKPEERENILSQHREVYNGYQTLNPAAMNGTQPLYTQDFANDKLGMVVNNKGEVKAYTNMGINESIEKKLVKEEMCEQCNEEMSEQDDNMMDVAMMGDSIMRSQDFQKVFSNMDPNEFEDEFEYADNVIFRLLYKYQDTPYYEELFDYVKDMYSDSLFDAYAVTMGRDPFGDDDTLDIDYEEIDEIEADDMDISDEEPAYQFVSHGPDDVYGTMQDYDKETGSYHKIDSMNDVERYDDSSDINNMFGDLVDGLAFNDDEPSDTFQHDAGDIDREGDSGLGMDTENDMDLSKVKPAYDFMSDGPDDPYGVSEEEDLEEMVDEDLRESFKEKRKLVMEMINRMSKF